MWKYADLFECMWGQIYSCPVLDKNVQFPTHSFWERNGCDGDPTSTPRRTHRRWTNFCPNDGALEKPDRIHSRAGLRKLM